MTDYLEGDQWSLHLRVCRALTRTASEQNVTSTRPRDSSSLDLSTFSDQRRRTAGDGRTLRSFSPLTSRQPDRHTGERKSTRSSEREQRGEKNSYTANTLKRSFFFFSLVGLSLSLLCPVSRTTAADAAGG